MAGVLQDSLIVDFCCDHLYVLDCLAKQDLSFSLRCSWLQRYVYLPVFANEPPKPDNPLLHLDEVVVTPHSGASVIEAVISVIEHGMKNIANFELGNPIDPADWIVPPQTK